MASVNPVSKRTPLSQSSANIQRQKNSVKKGESLLDWAKSVKVMDEKKQDTQLKEATPEIETKLEKEQSNEFFEENEMLKMRLFDSEIEVMSLKESNIELKDALREALRENEILHNLLHSTIQSSQNNSQSSNFSTPTNSQTQ